MPHLSPVSFGHSSVAWSDHLPYLRQLLEDHEASRVCELGAGANPALELHETKSRGLEYTLLDISPAELDKAPSGFRKVQADLCESQLEVDREYDFVFSRMLLEHVTDARQFHANVWRMLRPGGVAFHFFPTLYSPVFLANCLIRPAWSERLLRAAAPRDPQREKKFAAYYKWCQGPSARQICRYDELGYDVLAYQGFFGHGYYAKIPVIGRLHRVVSKWLVAHPLPSLTSYAYLVLRRRLNSPAPAANQPRADNRSRSFHPEASATSSR
ncbi:MAG TPA: class I SAM-dependent methyltransferase [Pirellulales bacterium]